MMGYWRFSSLHVIRLRHVTYLMIIFCSMKDLVWRVYGESHACYKRSWSKWFTCVTHESIVALPQYPYIIQHICQYSGMCTPLYFASFMNQCGLVQFTSYKVHIILNFAWCRSTTPLTDAFSICCGYHNQQCPKCSWTTWRLVQV